MVSTLPLEVPDDEYKDLYALYFPDPAPENQQHAPDQPQEPDQPPPYANVASAVLSWGSAYLYISWGLRPVEGHQAQAEEADQ
uniref:Uncharacterized protein n=1 Tax=Leersia perrieri TaxID=77586 RepID=A0A0D9V3N6_9ORYZ